MSCARLPLETDGTETAALAAPSANTKRADLTATDDFVPVRDGVVLHLLERSSSGAPSAKSEPGAALADTGRTPRAVLMLPGALSNALQYDAPADSPLDRAARAGYVAFALDYEGTGQSTATVDGDAITPARMAAQIGDVIEWIRRERGVATVALIGSSIGASLAAILGSTESPIDPSHVGPIVLSAFVYRDAPPALTSADDAACSGDGDGGAPSAASESGYVTTDAHAYAPVLSSVEPDLAAWLSRALPGRYPIGPARALFELPLLRAEDGRAPAMVVYGSDDLLLSASDEASFVAAYGGPIQELVLEGAWHVPYYEPERDRFWALVFAFLASASSGGGGQ